MEIGAMLDELREMASKDEKIRQELLDTRKDTHCLLYTSPSPRDCS